VIQKSRVRVNGRQQVFIPVYRQGGASSLAVVAGLKDEIPRIEQDLPKGTKLDFVIDQTESVRQSISTLIHEGASGAALVALMILVFLGNWRMTLIGVLALPLAILCGIIGLSATNNTINLMTLAGLFLAIGPLVDNAIVVLENTHRHRTLGKSAARAAFDGAGELTLPVLVATAATIIVLAPIALMPGLGGFLFKPLALAVGFAMVASFLLAWTLVPALCSKLLKGHHAHGHSPHAGAPPQLGREEDRSTHGLDATASGNSSHSPIQDDPPSSGGGLFTRVGAAIQNFLTALTHRYESLLNMALRARWLVLLAVALLF